MHRDVEHCRIAQAASTAAKKAREITLECVVCHQLFTTTGDRLGAKVCGSICKKARNAEFNRSRKQGPAYLAWRRRHEKTSPTAREGARRRRLRRRERLLLQGATPPTPKCRRCRGDRAARKSFCENCKLAREVEIAQASSAAVAERYRTDPAYRQRELEKSKQYVKSHKAASVAKAMRNKARAKANDPERYRQMVNRHGRDSRRRAQAHDRETWTRRRWEARMKARYGNNISETMWELLRERRQLAIDILEHETGVQPVSSEWGKVCGKGDPPSGSFPPDAA